MTSSHKASAVNHNNTAGKQHRCDIPLIWDNEYPISVFLLEPLAKKICSISFVSQYIFGILDRFQDSTKFVSTRAGVY